MKGLALNQVKMDFYGRYASTMMIVQYTISISVMAASLHLAMLDLEPMAFLSAA